MTWLRRARSLRAKITASFTLIVVGGTVLSTLIGSRIITGTLLQQAQVRARQGLEAARTMYAERIGDVRAAVSRVASAPDVIDLANRGRDSFPPTTDLSSNAVGCGNESRPRFEAIAGRLAAHARDAGLDFLTFVNAAGCTARSISSVPHLLSASLPPLVGGALRGEAGASTEVLAADVLAAENPALAERARLAVVPVPNATLPGPAESTAGLVLLAAAPVKAGQATIGAVYGGVLLNGNYAIVDRVKRLLYGGETYRGRDVGTVSLFLDDVRVATNVTTAQGRRAVGTRVSAPVAAAVLGNGETWQGRAFVVDDWYVTAYRPIRNGSGRVIGILYAGLLEAPFLAARTEVMLTFLVVCLVGLVIVFALTYLMTRTTIRPLEEMVHATKAIASGNLDVRVAVRARDETGELAGSFNNMLDSLQTMKSQLEDWARTLEVRVQERTDQLVAVQSRMAQSEKLASIGRLAAGVAHGINNPLGGILALTMLALEECDANHPLREDLETIVAQAKRCRDIVKGLLDFSRQSETRASNVNVNEIVESTISLLERQALFYNVRTVRKFTDDLPWVKVDPGQLQEVLVNIVLNAVDAMEQSGVLTVETDADPERAHVVIRINDTGKGIPPDVLPLVFEPFFTTKKVGEGTGLGLAIAHGIVTRAGGTVDVKSAPGNTTFTVRLPAAQKDAEDEAVEAVGRRARQPAPGR
jgi:two-component system NtrC family sensor kinase